MHHRFGQTVREEMLGLCFSTSGLHPLVFGHARRKLFVAAHADDVLCIGSLIELQWMYGAWKEYGMKKHSWEPDSGEEVRYLNRVLRRGAACWKGRECDPKHVQTLVRECGTEGCEVKEASITKEGPDNSMGGEP